MAKRRDVRLVDAAEEDATPELSAKVKRAVTAITAPFKAFTRQFAAMSIRREELAPKFMNAARLWMAETNHSFVEFVRFLDPNVGGTRNEYRSHRTYQAADYLRRLDQNLRRKSQTAAGGGRAVDAPAPPTDVVARILGSLMEIIPEERQQEVWDSMASQLHWTPRQIQRLQTQVEHVDPLVHIRARVENLRLSFPVTEEAEEQAA